MDPDIFQQDSFSPELCSSHHLLQNRFLHHSQTALPVLHALRPAERREQFPLGSSWLERQLCSEPAPPQHPPDNAHGSVLLRRAQREMLPSSPCQRAANCQQAVPVALHSVTGGRQCSPEDSTRTHKPSPVPVLHL